MRSFVRIAAGAGAGAGAGAVAAGFVARWWGSGAPTRWSDLLERWLLFRRRVQEKFGISVRQESHANELVHGRGGTVRRASRARQAEGYVEFGRLVVGEVLGEISELEGAKVGSVWVKYDPALGHQGKIGLYRSLVNHIDAELCEVKELGLVRRISIPAGSSRRAP